MGMDGSEGGVTARAATPAESLGPLGRLDRFLVTLSESGAVTYLVENLAVAHGRRTRLRHSLARSLDVAGMRRLFEDVADDREIPERFREALRLLNLALGPAGASLFADSPFEERPPAGFVLLADYETRPRGQAVVFLFAAGEDRPRAVLKLRREPPGQNDAEDGPCTTLAREAAALDRLAALPAPLAATVPRRRGFHRFPGAAALLTSALPGRSAYVELHRGLTRGAGAARHLELAAVWLGRFQRVTRVTDPWRPPPPEDPRFDPVRRDDGSAPDWYRGLLDDLETSPLPASAGHGDFWARNLLVPPEGWVRDRLDRELPGVVDWEGYRTTADPFEDLFHFPWTYAALHPTGRRWTRRSKDGPARPDTLDAFRRGFLDDTALARRIRGYLQTYTVGAGLPWGLLEPLFRLFLLTRAAKEGETAENETAGKEGSWLRAYRALETTPRSVFSG
jgi:hypothetical protein